MMRTILVLALAVTLALAQTPQGGNIVGPGLPPGQTDVPNPLTVNSESQPFNSNMCAGDGSWQNIDKTEYYKANFQGVSRLCVKDYLTVCATPTGLVTCNTYNSACADVTYDWSDATQYPVSAANMAKRPQVCSSTAGYGHSDTMVVLVAQIVISGIVMIAVFVLFAIKANVGIGIKVVSGVYLLVCLFLLFGYYYLNSILIFTAVLAAGVCFSLKSDAAAAVGFGICLTALYWVTFQNGLGYVQHQSRFTAGDVTTDIYERMCNNYFRGYFYWPLEQHGEGDNIANMYRGLCDRIFLSSQLFFMIFAEQLLVVYIALGAMTQFAEPRVGEDGHVNEAHIPSK